MSMLAERKRKEKWCLNPRGKIWAEDSNKFGQKILEKMGWSKGKGLGANENGIQEHIRVTQKNDNKGMGYKENTEQWTENEDQFSQLLKDLSSNVTNSDTTEIECNDSSKVNSNLIKLQSLEKKSQNSRARVHYHKFTRGKDLSRYSEKDIASIFGKKSVDEINNPNVKSQKLVSKEKELENEIVAEDNIGNEQTSFGVTVIKGGTIQDYFNKRLKELKKNPKNNINDIKGKDNDLSLSIKVGSSTFYPTLNDKENNTEKEENKPKTKKRKLENGIESTEKHPKLDEDDCIGNESIINSKKKNKKRKLTEFISESNIQENLIEDNVITSKISEHNKKNINNGDSTLSTADKDFEDSTVSNDVHKISNEKQLNEPLSFVNVDETMDECSHKVKKKKKNKKDNVSCDLNSDFNANIKSKDGKKNVNSPKESLKGYENAALQLIAGNDNLEINDFLQNTEKKKKRKSKKKDDSEIDTCQGVINLALELSAEDSILYCEESTVDTKKKSKKKKSKEKQMELNIANGIENPALEMSNEDNSVNEETKDKKKNRKKVDLGITNEGLQLSDNDTEEIKDTDTIRKKSKKSKKNVSENINNENTILDDTDNSIKQSKKHKKLKQVGIENPGLDISCENSDINNSEILKDTDFNQIALEVCCETKKSKKGKKSINAGIENLALDINCDQSDNVGSELGNAFEIIRKKNKKIKKLSNLGIENPALDLKESNTENVQFETQGKKRKHTLNEIGIINPALDLSHDDNDLQTPSKKCKKNKQGIENPSLNLESEIPNNNVPTPKSALKKKCIDNTDSSIKLGVHVRRKVVIIDESLNEEKYITDHETTFENSDEHVNISDSPQVLNSPAETEPGNLSHILEKIDSYQNELENSINEAKEQKKEENRNYSNNLTSPMSKKLRKQVILQKLKNNDINVIFPGANINKIKGYGSS